MNMDLKEDYMPRNANKKYGGEYTLMNGLAQSKNSITAFNEESKTKKCCSFR